MRWMISLLLISFSLNAKELDNVKIREAVLKAQLELTKNFCLEKANTTLDLSGLKDLIGPFRSNLNGLTIGTQFKFYAFNLRGMEKPAFPLKGWINKNGEAWVDHSEKKPLSDLQHVAYSTLPGEPIFNLIVIDETDEYLAARFVPIPIEITDSQGRKLSMEVLNREDTYLVKCENFKPGEKIDVILSSSDVTDEKSFVIPESKNYHFFIKKIRSSKIAAERNIQLISNQCEPLSLNYNWRFILPKLIENR